MKLSQLQEARHIATADYIDRIEEFIHHSDEDEMTVPTNEREDRVVSRIQQFADPEDRYKPGRPQRADGQQGYAWHLDTVEWTDLRKPNRYWVIHYLPSSSVIQIWAELLE